MKGETQNKIFKQLTGYLAVFTLLALILVPMVQRADAVDPDNIISYQGRLLDSNGVPLAAANADMQFRFYDAAVGGSCLWSNDDSGCATNADVIITLTDGLFSENLGDTGDGYAAINDTVFADNDEVFLEVEVEGETLTPRKRVVATPYALNAQTLDGVDSTGFLSSTGDTATGEYTFTGAEFLGASPLVFEGATNDGVNLTSFAITDPTGANTITFQDGTGTVAFLSDITGGLWEDGANGVLEDDEAVIVGGDVAFDYATGGVGDLRVADELEVLSDAWIDNDLVVGASTSSTETMANAGFALGGDDLFVAGMAGVEGNIYTDGRFIAGASSEYGDGLITDSGGDFTFTLGAAGDDLLIQTGNLKIGNAAPSVALDGEDLYVEGNIETASNLYLTASTNLYLDADTTAGESTAATDSGAYLIGVFDEFGNSNSTNVQDVLDDLDAAIVGGGGNTLDLAYDQGGAGAGRSITVDSGALQFAGSNAADETLEISQSTDFDLVSVLASNTGFSNTILNISSNEEDTGGFYFMELFSDADGVPDREFYIDQDGNVAADGRFAAGGATTYYDDGSLYTTAATSGFDIDVSAAAGSVDVILNGGNGGDDFTVDTDVLVVESDNDQVGVGTSSPGALFEVENSAAATAAIIDQDGEGSSLLVDTTAVTSHTLSVSSNSTTTGNVLNMSATALTSGDLINLTRNSVANNGGFISMNDGTDETIIFNYGGSPNGALTAPRGSIALDYTNGRIYINTDDANTWSQLGVAGAGNTLDLAYDQGGAGAGRQVTVDSSAIEFTGSNAADYTLEVTTNAAGGALYVNDTDGSGLALHVDNGDVQFDDNVTLGGAVTDAITVTGAIQGASALYFDGATDDTWETIFAMPDPAGSDNTITFQNGTGTVAFLSDIGSSLWTDGTNGYFSNTEAIIVGADAAFSYGSGAAGDLKVDDELEVLGDVYLGNASGDAVTSNAADWTFANDTAVTLSGGVDGLNFDSNTLSIDATNNRVGIGTAAPGSALSISSADTTNDVFSITASSLTTGEAISITRSAVANNGGFINMNDGTDSAIIFTYGGSPDTALTAPRGSIALDYTNGRVYVNTNDGTSWSQLAAAGSGNTLDLAYDEGGAGSGRVINVTDGAVEMTGTNAADYTLEVTTNAAGGALYVNDTNGTGYALLIDAGDLRLDDALTIGDAAGDTVTSNAADWTFANDTAVTLSGGVDGLNFDSNTLSIDATNNRVGIGTAAPDARIEVETTGTTGVHIDQGAGASALDIDSAARFFSAVDISALSLTSGHVVTMARTGMLDNYGFINLNDSTDSVVIFTYNGDPNTNLVAPIGSIALDYLNGALHVHTGADGTNTWEQVITSGYSGLDPTLDDAYNNDGGVATLTVDSGAIVMTGSNAADYTLEVTTNAAGGALYVNDTDGSGLALHVDNGDVQFDDNVTLGDGANDDIDVNGEFISDLIPNADDTYTLGDADQRWADIFLGSESIHIGTATADEYIIGYDTVNNALVYNEAGDDFDVRIEGSGEANLFMVDAGNDRVGVGTAAPSDLLTVIHGAADSVYLDAITTDSTTTAGVLDIDVDSSTDLNYAISIDYELTDDNSAGANGQGGVRISPTQSSNDGDNLVGMNIDDLAGTAGSGFEIGVMVGTDYDFGLISSSAGYFSGATDLAVIGDSERTASLVISGGSSTDPGDDEIVDGIRVINQSDLDPANGQTVNLYGIDALSHYNGADTDSTLNVAGVYAYGAASSGTGTTNVFGVDALAQEHGGTVANAYGIRAQANTAATTNYGVYAAVSGGTTNYAGIFTGGNVGIGTASPDADLEITSTEDTERIRLYDSTNSDYAGLFVGTGDPNTQTSGAGAGSLFMDEAGTVWIATADGDASWSELAAAGSGLDTLDDAYDNFGASAQLVTVDDATTGLEFSVDAAGDYVIDLQSTGDFLVQAGGTDFATFNNTGSVAFANDVDLGSSNADNITINGQIDSDVIPDADDTYNLGSDSLRWQEVWIGPTTIHIGNTQTTDEYTISYNDANNQLVLNEAGLDFDMRIEGDNIGDLFYVDAGDDRVAIGTNAAGARLDVLADLAEIAFRVNTQATSTANAVLIGNPGSGDAVLINNTGSGEGIDLDMTDPNNDADGIAVTHASNGTGDGITVSLTDNSNNGSGVAITHAGPGDALSITKNIAGFGIDLDMAANSPVDAFGLSVDVTNAGAGSAMAADFQGSNVQIWDGAASVDFATGEGDLYVEDDLEVDGTIYGTVDPGFTVGSVVFAAAGGFTEDNANFFWDDTNDRLGLGTATPSSNLDIAFSPSGSGTAITMQEIDLDILNSDQTANITGLDIDFTDGINNSTATNIGISIDMSNLSGGTDTGLFVTANDYAAVFSNGNVGIGDTSPDADLDILSDAAGESLLNLEALAFVDQDVIHLENSGSGTGFRLSNQSSSNSYGIYLSQAANQHSILVQSDSTTQSILDGVSKNSSGSLIQITNEPDAAGSAAHGLNVNFIDTNNQTGNPIYITPSANATVGQIHLGTGQNAAASANESEIWYDDNDDQFCFDNGTEFCIDNTVASGTGSTGQVTFWTAAGLSGENNLYWDASNDELGIGTNAPDYTLDVAGNAGFDEYLYHNADPDTNIRYDAEDSLIITVGGVNMLEFDEDVADELVVNEGSANTMDFRVEGATDANLLFLDGSADAVGIGESAPDASAKFEVAGNIMLDDYVYFNNATTEYLRHDGTTFVMSDDLLPSADTYDLGSSTSRWQDLYLGPSTLHIGSDGDESRITYTTASDLLTFQNSVDSTTGFQFLDAGGGTPILNIDTTNEWVGIGTATPNVALAIDGGISRDPTNNNLYGLNADTHVNLGNNSTTGNSGSDWSYATVSGGNNNTAGATYSVVGGGASNSVASGSTGGAVLAGFSNTVSGGTYGAIGGGSFNTTAADNSWVGGRRVSMGGSADYSFAWGYDSGLGTIDLTDNYSFYIFPIDGDADGSAGQLLLNTDTAAGDLTVVGYQDTVASLSSSYTTGTNAKTALDIDLTNDVNYGATTVTTSTIDVYTDLGGDQTTGDVTIQGIGSEVESTNATGNYYDIIGSSGIASLTTGDVERYLVGVRGAANKAGGTITGGLNGMMGTIGAATVESGGGTADYLYGSWNQSNYLSTTNNASTEMYGSFNQAYMQTAVTVGEMYGAFNRAWVLNASAATSELYGSYNHAVTNGTNASGYGIYAEAERNGGSGGYGIGGYFKASGYDSNTAIYTEAGRVHIDNAAYPGTASLYAAGSGELFVVGDIESGSNIYVPNGFICADNDNNCGSGLSAGDVSARAYDSGGSDVAEVFDSLDTLVPGELVVIDVVNDEKVKRTSHAYEGVLVGIVASDPGLTLGARDPGYPIALKGRVPVRVTDENGPVEIGDYLTSSSTPGYAMKAIEAGPTVGRAMQNAGIGNDVIVAYVNTEYYTGAVIGTDGTDTLVGDTLVMNALGEANAGTPVVDSETLVLRGSAWNGTSALNQDMKVNTLVSAEDDYRLSISNTNDAEVVYFTNEGDVMAAGRIYPSDRGTLQTDKYIYYDGSVGPGGDMMRTNASGWSTGSYDFAEMFPSDQELEPGDVVVFDTASEHVRKSDEAYDGMVAGIVSTKPGFLAGENNEGDYPIALAGRVPTKVSLENGPIAVGDPLTTSSTPGYAMKATEAGSIVGNALENYNGDGDDTIIAFVNVSYWGGGLVDTTPGTNNTTSNFGGVGSNVDSLTLGGNLYMQANDIINVNAITGLGDWEVSPEGDFKTKGSFMAVIETYQGEEVEVQAELSLEATVTMSGTAQLSNGQVTIDFEDIDPRFNDIISTIAPVRVMAMPIGEPVQLYVNEQSNDGFTIMSDSLSDAEFNWFVTAYRKDMEPEKYLEPEEEGQEGQEGQEGSSDDSLEEESVDEEPADEELVDEEPIEEEPVEEESTEEEPVEDPVENYSEEDVGAPHVEPASEEPAPDSESVDEPDQVAPTAGNETDSSDTSSDPPTETVES